MNLIDLQPAEIRMVVFDLDGTLFKTETIVLEAVRGALEELSAHFRLDLAFPSDREILSQVGASHRAFAALLHLNLDAGQQEFLRRAIERRELQSIEAGKGALYPDTLETLQSLRRSGLEIGVVSNCSRAYLLAVMDRFGLDEWVDLALCLYDLGNAGKADILRELLDNRMVLASDVTYVGDRRPDLEAAQAAGVCFIACLWGYASPGELEEATTSVKSFKELLRLLENKTNLARAFGGPNL